ncbi:MAG: NAD(P)H-hydrate dehydratase [Pseudodonghicola sp.]
MAELLTAAQMRAIEQAAIAAGEATGLELMERAGQGVVAAVFEEWPELSLAPRRAVVLCGPGNNGGDGFVVARLLKARGWDVEVFLHGDPAKLPPDAKANCERWCELGLVKELTYRSVKDAPDADLYFDAVFGTGLTRPVTGELGDLLRYLAGSGGDGPFFRQRLVAVDIASGLSSDSGRVPGAGQGEWAPACPGCVLTVSFHRAKIGHYLGRGPERSGKLVVKDIGLEHGAPPSSLTGAGPVVPPSKRVSLVETVPGGLGKMAAGHKYAHGHALILSGGAGHTGAARLAARGALRIGAGLVTLGVPPAAQQEVACQITALMLRRVADGAALSRLLEDRRINALCLGPGLGLGEAAAERVTVALAARRATVLDADALTLIAGDAALFDALHDKCVLTPHGGEFARLFPDLAEKLADPVTEGPAYSKVDAARDAAKRAGCVVLFKGADTVIATPGGHCEINSAAYERAAPWLATAGSGDVLAGFIAGLLARGLPPSAAAETAAWLHVECARSYGPGLIAEDIPECLPQVFRTLGL